MTKVEKILIKHNYRDFVLFKLGINCGLRISDILALNVGDVKNKNFIILTEKKTGKIRKIPVNLLLKNLLKTYTKNKTNNMPLFASMHSGKRLDRFCVYKIIKNACRKAQIECNIGTHTLRKTFGYHYYKKYKDIAMLQKIFNHSSPSVTLRYIGIEQEDIYKSYIHFLL